jgi:YbgC/YbaW family acyl-CoA thioester hydrolase
VQFYETDVAGIVHFSWFYRYMEEAEHAMWREAGLSIYVPSSDIGWPRIAASFEFYRALRFEDEFEVHLTIAEVATSTIRYDCTLRKGDETMARGTMTIACVRKLPDRTMKATAIPSDILERLGQG